jgi:hypothetical protein
MCHTYLCVHEGCRDDRTHCLDRDLLRRLKILAAKLATSINALFNAELRHLVETYEVAEAHGNHNFQTLLDFSLGRINDLQAIEALGIQSEEDLFLLMARAHLPMPRLADGYDFRDDLRLTVLATCSSDAVDLA